MLNSIANNQNLLKPESLYAVMHKGVIANTIHSRAFLFGKIDMGKFIRRDIPLCACGCGERVKNKYNRFISGHQNRGRKKNKRHKLKLSIANIGKKHSEETKAKISSSNRGQKRSFEFRKRMSEIKKGKPLPRATIEASIKSRRENAKKYKLKPQLCECGCNQLTNPGKRYIQGHFWKNKKHTQASKIKISQNAVGTKGKIFSDEHRKKIGLANHENYKDGKHPCIGRKCTEKTKRKISIANMGKNNGMYGKCGALHPQWKGGTSTDPYCHIWGDQEYKKDIKMRDDNICQNPNCSGKCNRLPLHIHHVNYDKMNCHPWNIITLCCSCNAKANKNREYWEIFYQNILFEKYNYKALAA